MFFFRRGILFSNSRRYLYNMIRNISQLKRRLKAKLRTQGPFRARACKKGHAIDSRYTDSKIRYRKGRRNDDIVLKSLCITAKSRNRSSRIKGPISARCVYFIRAHYVILMRVIYCYYTYIRRRCYQTRKRNIYTRCIYAAGLIKRRSPDLV